MYEEEIIFKGNKICRCVPLPKYGGEVCKLELIMTKEIFVECYEKWIKQQTEGEKQNEDEEVGRTVSENE